MDALNLGVSQRLLREMQRQYDHDCAAGQQDRRRTSPTGDSTEYAHQVESQCQPQFGSIWLRNRQEGG